MRNALIALSSISKGDLLLYLILQVDGGHRGLLGTWEGGIYLVEAKLTF